VSLAVSLSASPPGQRFTAANLTRDSGFTGVDGIVRFAASGLPERGLAVIEVQTYGVNVTDPPPGAIDGATRVSAVPSPKTTY
jgi:hypothetical protein